MGFLRKMLGNTTPETVANSLTPQQCVELKSWPLFKPNYSDQGIHEALNRRTGNNDPYTPLYEAMSVGQYDAAKMLLLGKKMGLAMSYDNSSQRMSMDQKDYRTMTKILGALAQKSASSPAR
jgi:hypothetical protein